jgi:hypothetical protein
MRANLADLLTGRRGYMAAAMAILIMAALTVSRFGPPASEAHVPDEADMLQTSSTAGVAGEPAAERGADSAPPESPPSPQDVGGTELFAIPPIADGVPRSAKPAVVRGIYLNAWAAGSSRKLARLIDIANRTEINTFVIDVKEGGHVSYRSSVPLARQIGADQPHIRDIRGVLRQLRENGIYPIARIVVFRDATLAQARPDWAVRHVDGGDWIDHYGHRWVDSYNRAVWDYNIAIAREALELGFSEVQWDYVRFPDVPASIMRTAHWPAQDGRSKADGIREFLIYSREQLASYGVPVTADVFGLTVSAGDDMGIGQLWEKMVDATDVLLPMVYPSHFARGTYGIAAPNARPYDVVRRSMEDAIRRTAGVPGAATIRPWLQDFTLGPPRYGPEHVRAQIDAVYAAGLQEWVLWHPGSNYTEAALALADGTVPELRPPADVTPPAATTSGTRRRTPLGSPVDG